MKTEHIIIQAGGRGSRLMHLTKNKPKGIVPINNKPIIFNLFDKFKETRFVIIGDYLFDVLKKYLDTFADIKHIPVKATGEGTCGGIKQALSLIPEKEPFMLIWSDLILPDNFNLDFEVTKNLVGISKDFPCRWSYKNGIFEEIPSKEHGVAGIFIFKDKSFLGNIPDSGELVRWLSKSEIQFEELELWGVREVGTIEAYNETEKKSFRCRPFNEITVKGETVTKNFKDKQGEALSKREISWYKEACLRGFSKIPKIISYEPLKMERIRGENIFKNEYLQEQKITVIDNITNALSELHGLKSVKCDKFSVLEAYYTKTIKRLSNIRNLIPHADERTITVNGKTCRNIFFCADKLYNRVYENLLETKFTFIHGDCTFSNTLSDENLNITFIDPRGYFGFTEICGDTLYDWAKVYYSVYGNYDQFNNKNFTLDITKNEIFLNIQSNGFESLSKYFLEKIAPTDLDKYKIKLIHAIIWLSLTTYAWEDYDSICGAFYNGIYHLEELL